MALSDHCPICWSTLTVLWRVEEVRIPGTVPEWIKGKAVYERHDSWEEVECRNGHTFKRRGSGLYGMAA